MDFVEYILTVVEISAACFLLGFCISLGMMGSFLLITKLFGDDDCDGVIGH